MLRLSAIAVKLDPAPGLVPFRASIPTVGNLDASTTNRNENMLAKKITSQKKIGKLDSMKQSHSRQIADEKKTEILLEPLQRVIWHVQ